MDSLVTLPNDPIALELSYKVSAREKRAFQTPLDANVLLKGVTEPGTVRIQTRVDGQANATIEMDLPLANGRIQERFEAVDDGKGLRSHNHQRTVLNSDGTEARREVVDFRSNTIPLPESAYPEVMLPFLLAWEPVQSTTRSLYAWINDRFVAHVYFEEQGKPEQLTVPAGTFATRHVMMYPDLNEWVPMGKVLTKLSKPFIPKYRMWFSDESPARLIRFEGPYGPPGAPEIVLELS